MKKTYLFLLALAVTLSLAIPLILGGLSQFYALALIPWWLAGLLLSMIIISWGFNAYRVRLLVRAIGHDLGFIEGILIVISAEFAGVATPWDIGMPVAYTFLLGKKELPLGKAMGLVTVIVLFDLAFYVVTTPLAAAALLLQKPPGNSVKVITVVLGIVGACLISVVLVFRFYRQMYYCVSGIMSLSHWLSKYRFRFARKVVEFLWAMRIISHTSWRRRIGIILTTGGYWLPRYSILIIIIFLLGKSVPVAYLFLVQALLNLGGIAIALPGGSGGVGVGYDILMSPYLTRPEIAFSLFIFRAANFYWYLIVGAPIFLYKSGEAAHYLLSGEKPPSKSKKSR